MNFQMISIRLCKITDNGSFIGWLEQSTRRSAGLNAKRYTLWSGVCYGTNISKTSLTAAKLAVKRAIAATRPEA